MNRYRRLCRHYLRGCSFVAAAMLPDQHLLTPRHHSGRILFRRIGIFIFEVLHGCFGIALEVEFDGLAQIGDGFFIGGAITGNVDIQTAGDENSVLGIDFVLDFVTC